MAAVTVADAVVVGGGISGIMSAYYLAAAGLKALLIERGVLAGEASGRNGGHVSPSTYDSAQRELGYLALRLWPELVQEIELPTEYVQGGALSIFLAEEAEAFSERAQRATSGGEPTELLDAAALRGMVPHVPADAAGAVFMPQRGNVNPILAAKSFAAAAESLGATIWEGVAVTDVAVERDAVTGVHTTRGYVATPLLVNCAGVIRRGAELDPEVFADVVDVNLTGSMRACAAARPRLKETGGSIVNTASILSFFGGGLVPGYAASKGGIAQMTKSLAIEYATRGIRVNAVAPGIIKTPMHPAETHAFLNSLHPIGHMGEISDIVGAILYLESAPFVTGEILHDDGGQSAGH